ncbi:transcriptional regulator, GntR family [Pseudorhodobacter antarcticus]|uniref:Transcriptional regulator, GntR family n=1 Tax=Pseudorhodobacter antarcticus TaxID=1077947 RepID=A0A1H8KR37_9RHOB|nr:GntR family transcriptional regulator [Pseudorhodobacter antarcticus]SEN95370.1 transcriptional regulator, GntR family [Pseudorhodobacter antarcticus]
MPDPVEKPLSNAASAVDSLRALIFDGSLAAGSDHLESELALRLGMSRTPVREAVLTLAAQGLLDVRPRKGVRILPVSPADMREIYDVLTELESLAAADAARRNHSPAALQPLAQTILDMDTALTAKNREAWADADDRFHTELVRLGGNSRIIMIVGMMADQVRRARAVTLYMRPVPSQSNADHRGVLEAIRNRDPKAAERIHRAHRIGAKEMLTELLDRYRLQNL